MSEDIPAVPRRNWFLLLGNALFWVAAVGLSALPFGGGWWMAAFAIVVALGTVLSWFGKTSAPPPKEEPPEPRHEGVVSADPEEAAEARGKLLSQFLVTLFLVAMVSLLLAGLTGVNYILVLSAVLSGLFFTGAMVLVWALSHAVSGKRQFSISSMLLLMAILAAYLGVIRFLTDRSGLGLVGGDNPFLVTAVICLLLTFFSAPLLAQFLESFVWMAAWIVRTPTVQRRLRK